MMEHQLSLENKEFNNVELHYWFDDETHTMDAFVQNKSELIFLSIIKQLADDFNCVIEIETFPLENGGLRRIFRVISKSEKKGCIITTAVLTSILTAVITTPITTSINAIVSKIFEDTEKVELGKAKLRLEIEGLKLDNQNKKEERDSKEIKRENVTFGRLKNPNMLVKKRSDFYKEIDSYDKVSLVSIKASDSEGESVVPEIKVRKADFKKYIVEKEDIEPIIIDHACVEIIQPVLTKDASYKWRGIYLGKSISFDMQSNKFKTLVQTGLIEFKNGSSIDCQLRIKRKLTDEGEIVDCGYQVLEVYIPMEENNFIANSSTN